VPVLHTLLLEIFTTPIITAREFLILKKDKTCCCDESCESVETAERSVPVTSYGAESKVVGCDFRGKQNSSLLLS
jgi:hypothetical protein